MCGCVGVAVWLCVGGQTDRQRERERERGEVAKPAEHSIASIAITGHDIILKETPILSAPSQAAYRPSRAPYSLPPACM